MAGTAVIDPPSSAPAAAGPAIGVIGPNAVLQLRAALDARFGHEGSSQIFSAAGQERYLREPPAEMIDEAVPAALFRALWNELPDHEAAYIARDAGRRTADYILAHRIPKAAQWLLKRLPARYAAPILLKAVQKSAWTFAGSGRCTTHTGQPAIIEIADNPIAMPGCLWHCAVFERLFNTLVAPNSQVQHTQCITSAGRTCRFEIDTAGPGPDR